MLVAAGGVQTKHFSSEGEDFHSCQVSRLRAWKSGMASSSLCLLFFFVYLPASDYGLFLSDEDPRKGIWLEAGRTLDYYMLRNGVCLWSRFSVFSLLCLWSQHNYASKQRKDPTIYILIQGHLSSSFDVMYFVRGVQVVIENTSSPNSWNSPE